jgi:hypothetical protein
VGSKRIGQVRFQVYSGDHLGADVPHFHAFIGRGSLAIELMPDGLARISRAHRKPDAGYLTKRDIQIILATAEAAHEELIALWEASR